MYALTVIGAVVVFAKDKPIMVVCVLAATVTTVEADVPTFFVRYDVKLFAIMVPYPSAIAIATPVPT
jgi:hypothetical protein